MTTTAGASQATAAFLDIWKLFLSAFPEGWCREEPGLVSYVAGTEIAETNGAVLTDDDVDPDRVLAVLDEVARSGKPYSVQGRALAVEAVVRRTDARFVRDADRPLMVLPRGAQPFDLGGLRVRGVEEPDRDLFVRTATAAFGAPDGLFAQMFTEAVFGLPGMRSYLGEVGGEVVATACGVTVGDAVGIFTIGTLPAHRGRGYGAAITAVAAEDGFAAGAELAVLQASEMGLPVYERMGYKTVDVWSMWVHSEG